MQPKAHIHIVVPFCNVDKWIERCLRSVNGQILEAGNPVVHVVDDSSTDGSSERAEALCKEFGFRYHRNVENQKCPLNIFQAIQHSEARPWDVIFLLDGDDYLPHCRVLRRIEEVFAEANTWLTYGQYMSDPPDFGCAPAIPLSDDAVERREFRKSAAAMQYFNHPLVFRRFLFDAIPVAEMQDSDGKWFTSGYDRVIMIPMLEMATPPGALPHWKFVNEIFYAYNSENFSSEVNVPERQIAAELVDQIYSRPILPPFTLTPRQGSDWLGLPT